MSHELMAAFALFAVATLFTPGPNNLMLMTSGLNWGAQRSIPHLLGVCIGFSFMVVLVGLGLGQVFQTWPWLYTGLQWVGAVYLLYLAWHIARAGPIDETDKTSGRPLTFIEAALFQWVNPKAWVMSVGAVSAYAGVAPFPWNVGVMAGCFLVLGFALSGAWLMFGHWLRDLLRDARWVRLFNGLMAALLVASLLPLVLSAIGR